MDQDTKQGVQVILLEKMAEDLKAFICQIKPDSPERQKAILAIEESVRLVKG